jgi:hypothetical protein
MLAVLKTRKPILQLLHKQRLQNRGAEQRLRSSKEE